MDEDRRSLLSDSELVEVGKLDVEWLEVIQHSNGSVEKRQCRLTTKRVKVSAMWIVIIVLVITTAIVRPDLVGTVWEKIAMIWPRAG